MRKTPQRVLAGRAVSAQMRRLGVSSGTLARRMGMSNAELEAYLSGEMAFTVDQLEDVSTILGVQISTLLGRKPPEE